MYITPDRYEWTDAKREANIEKHGIDFVDAIAVFDAPHFIFRSDRGTEERYGAVGPLHGRLIVVIYHDRMAQTNAQTGGVRRIISARRARTNEEKDYGETRDEG